MKQFKNTQSIEKLLYLPTLKKSFSSVLPYALRVCLSSFCFSLKNFLLSCLCNDTFSSGNIFVSSSSWKIVCHYEILSWQFFDFSTLKEVTSLLSGLHDFLMRNLLSFKLFFLYWDCAISLWFFSRFFFWPHFSKFAKHASPTQSLCFYRVLGIETRAIC